MSAKLSADEGRGWRDIVLFGLVLLVASACATAVIALPRAALPLETRPLALDSTAIEGQLASDHTQAGRVPDDERVARLETLIGEHGIAELARDERPAETLARAHEIAELATALEAEHHGALDAIRARYAEGIGAMVREEDPGKRNAYFGGFFDVLERYGLANSERTTTSAFAVRTLFKARFNGIASRPLTEGFSTVERLAYHGTLAYEALEAPADLRLARLRDYEHLAASSDPFSRAALLAMANQLTEAMQTCRELHERTGSIRARNCVIATEALAGE